MRAWNFMLRVSALISMMALAGCNRGKPDGDAKDPTAELPARFKTQEPVAKPDFTVAARDPKFQEAIKEAEALLGARPETLKSEDEDAEVKGGVSFDVPHGRIERILFEAHTNFLAKGFYLFRYLQLFGVDNEPDKIGLLPTSDKYAVIAAMGTNGDNYDIGTAGVIAWMKELEADQPFVLTGIGVDYMEGNFTTPLNDAGALARRMYQFCPDIVDQGTDTVEALAAELRKGRLYFWWD
jgi:hypothetical protein